MKGEVERAVNRHARADFFMGLIFLALGLATSYGAWTMDRLAIRRIHPLSAPGLVPGLLGLALSLCAVLLLAGAVRAGGHRRGDLKPDQAAALRLGLTLALTLAYPLLLIGILPFWLATALFVFAFIVLFEWPTRRGTWARAVGLATALVQAVLIAIVVSYVFETLFLVRLP